MEREKIFRLPENKYLKGIYCDVGMTLIDPFLKVVKKGINL